MYDVLHFLKLTLNAQKLIGFHRVLPLSEEALELWELHGVIGSDIPVEYASRLELLSECHDQFVEKGSGCALIILIVSHGCCSNAVKRNPAVAFADVILQRDTGLASGGDAASDCARVEIDQIFGDSSLVEPEFIKIHVRAEELGILCLPLVDVQCDEFH